VKKDGDRVSLTTAGLREGQGLIRSHRLWESYLCDRLGVCAENVHFSAHELEHYTDEAMQSELYQKAGYPTTDPHSRKIPDSG
jgi:Mn-dependent DtxR family transcriptional regulator